MHTCVCVVVCVCFDVIRAFSEIKQRGSKCISLLFTAPTKSRRCGTKG